MTSVEMDWLETYLAVVDRGGFTAASVQVHRSQSRVSAHIAALERELGTPLIDRSHRPASVTPAGEMFANHARQILAEVGSARSAMSAVRSTSGRSVTVLTTSCIGAAFFPRIFTDLVTRHPDVRLTLLENGLTDASAASALDGIAITVAPTLEHPLPPGLREQVLWREGLRVVVPVDHALGALSSLDTPALSTLPLVVTGASGSGRPDVIELLGAGGVTVASYTAVDTVPALLALVRAGLGVGVLGSLAAENAATADLAVLDVADSDLVREIAAYWYPALTITDVGRSLHDIVLGAALPKGVTTPGAA
jgi:DNA-binding transcriptional LysR family regulator